MWIAEGDTYKVALIHRVYKLHFFPPMDISPVTDNHLLFRRISVVFCCLYESEGHC